MLLFATVAPTHRALYFGHSTLFLIREDAEFLFASFRNEEVAETVLETWGKFGIQDPGIIENLLEILKASG